MNQNEQGIAELLEALEHRATRFKRRRPHFQDQVGQDCARAVSLIQNLLSFNRSLRRELLDAMAENERIRAEVARLDRRRIELEEALCTLSQVTSN